MLDPTSEPVTKDAIAAASGVPGPLEASLLATSSDSTGRKGDPLRANALARAREVINAAGRALDPNTQDGQDLPRAATLLAEAIDAAVSAISSHETTGDPERAIAALDDTVLKATIGNRSRAVSLARAIAPTRSLRRDDLQRAELFAAKLLEYAAGGRAVRRAEVRGAVALFLVAGTIVCVVSGMLLSWMLTDRYRFHTSSHYENFRDTGRLGDRGPFGLLFHTKNENHPWIDIDLGGRRNIQHVEIENRTDCCSDRAVPLVVEIRDGDGHYQEVARQIEDFDAWTATFPSRAATAVRLSVPKTTAFHLVNVRIK